LRNPEVAARSTPVLLFGPELLSWCREPTIEEFAFISLFYFKNDEPSYRRSQREFHKPSSLMRGCMIEKIHIFWGWEGEM
jgi:hypothetical protein